MVVFIDFAALQAVFAHFQVKQMNYFLGCERLLCTDCKQKFQKTSKRECCCACQCLCLLYHDEQQWRGRRIAAKSGTRRINAVGCRREVLSSFHNQFSDWNIVLLQGQLRIWHFANSESVRAVWEKVGDRHLVRVLFYLFRFNISIIWREWLFNKVFYLPFAIWYGLDDYAFVLIMLLL